MLVQKKSKRGISEIITSQLDDTEVKPYIEFRLPYTSANHEYLEDNGLLGLGTLIIEKWTRILRGDSAVVLSR